MTNTSAIKLQEYTNIPSDIPIGQFKYSSLSFAYRHLPDTLYPLLKIMTEGLINPRITYRYSYLLKGEGFGHCKYHLDGLEKPDEIPRLITQGGLPTLGENAQVLTANNIWEFSGTYSHRAQPTDRDTWRLMIRVSQTAMKYRNHWL